MCSDVPQQSILLSVAKNATKRMRGDNLSLFRMIPKSLDTGGNVLNLEIQVPFGPFLGSVIYRYISMYRLYRNRAFRSVPKGTL